MKRIPLRISVSIPELGIEAEYPFSIDEKGDVMPMDIGCTVHSAGRKRLLTVEVPIDTPTMARVFAEESDLQPTEKLA